MSFATYPSVYIYEKPDGKKKTEHLLWGDLIELKGRREGEWVKVKGRNQVGWMRERDTVSPQLLEVNFVDVGQGDGCFIVTPDDKFILVDAGEQDNMFRFLSWRFSLRKYPEQVVTINGAVMTHSDWDHSGGFARFFSNKQFRFEQVYHNGIIERPGPDPLGLVEKDGRFRYLTQLVEDRAALDQIAPSVANLKAPRYLKMLCGAAGTGRVGDIRMLCADDGFLPGYEIGRPLTVQVLGPVPESASGKKRLRWFADAGKTKNGHSIILKLEYGIVKLLLGGDLNVPAERYLLQHYAQRDPADCTSSVAQQQLIDAARPVFQADVAKACHHGSADFTELYLQVLNPLATIVSSGDEEAYCHPRPDALGAFGKYGRGPRPLIFSTELARSTKEKTGIQPDLRKELKELIADRKAAKTNQAIAASEEQIDKCLSKLERRVAVYGMINVRTDGSRVLIAQKLERPAANGERWDIHLLAPDAGGNLQYVTD